MENRPVIKISLFSRLVMIYNDNEIILSDYLGKQLLILLEMLIYYRQNAFSNDLIIEAIWSHHKNPRNAMKYSIHRLRMKLVEIPGLENLDFIVTAANGYILNPAYTYQVDCEEFFKLHQVLKNKKINQETELTALKLIYLYQGQIYQSPKIQWAIYINDFCKKIYLYYVEILCEYFLEQEKYTCIIRITQHAAAMVPEYEKAYYYHFKALISQQKFHEAREYYDVTIKQYAQKYKLTLNQEFRELFHQLMLNNKKTTAIDDIYTELLTVKQRDNTFFCEFDVFEYIFEKAIRDQKRYHLSYYLILFSLESYPENQEMKIMLKLKKIIFKTMRSTDSFTRINELQFLTLITCNEEEDVHTIAQRVIQRFYRVNTSSLVKIGYSIKKV
ncbi:winged helix-turn-helix domain-containing protein [Candidatus Stoquefichus sp. SB1]|uniref:winged helix-turn-helix domain-containing protein n=1 Tax=Candidatus Stoquefichus sp. SB1 TaxID=1658109 RepID=UPI00067F19CD|nr:winged helix-turn-helix domain-containing protein [Candidatus Stoquefichus sp. SB1]